MDDPKVIFYILCGIGIVGVIIYLVLKYEKNRSEALKNFALNLGFSFVKRFEPKGEILDFKIFQKGHSKKAFNLLEGNRGSHAYKIFDYRYTIGGGQGSSTQLQTIGFVHLNNLNLPHFIMGTESLFQKFVDKLGFKDIDFENYKEFSDHYYLKGENEAEIRNVFKPYILEYFRSKQIKETIEAKGNSIIFYKLRKRIKPDQLNKFIESFSEMVNIFDR